MGGLLLISPKDVIRMKVPFPNMTSGLAVLAHMYICKTVKGQYHEFIKCQTLKPYMLQSRHQVQPMTHFHDEQPDISRNPFSKPTRIDCDKIFASSTSNYSQQMRTTIRPDVSTDLFNLLQAKINQNTIQTIDMDENQLKSLNPYIT